MTRTKGNATPCLKAVGYWRMSSSPQEKSVPQQKAEMYPKAKLEGVELVQEFEDLGISGGSTKRDAFQEMVAFCAARLKAKDPVDAVVCFDTSRFSRADSNETSAAIWQLRQAGVNRVLTWERWWDFRKEEDRAIFNLQQDFTNNRYLRDLSLRVLRGKKDVSLAGFFTGGQIPYGFDRVMVGPDGTVGQRIPKGTTIAVREKGWRMALSPIPEDDPDPDRQMERQTVMWVFETFDRENISLRTIAKQLTDRGVTGPGARFKRKVPRPSDARWTWHAIREMLRNPVYKGVARVGYTSKGKYHRMVKGEIEAVEVTAPRQQSAANAVLRPMEYGGLVDVNLWERVQKKVEERSERKTTPRSNGYIVPPGILYCGHCGGRMHGQTFRHNLVSGPTEYRRLTCSTNKSRPGSCKDYSAAEQVVVQLLLDLVVKPFLTKRRKELVETAVLAEARKPKGCAGTRAQLHKKLGELDADILVGADNVLRAGDNFDEVNSRLTEKRQERARVSQQLIDLSAKPVRQVNLEQVRRAMAAMHGQSFDPAMARRCGLGEVFRRMLSRVELSFEAKPLGTGKRTRYNLTSVTIRTKAISA